MNMLYNGVELQEIPQRGETFSHSLIYSTVEDSTIVVLFTETAVALRTLSPLNFDVTYRNNAVYELNDSEGWKLRREEYGPVDGVNIGEIIWANYDVLDPDGNVYLAASEPLTLFVVTHTIHADLLERGVRPRIDVVQGDSLTRRVEFVLTAGGVPWNPPDDTAAALSYVRPDGAGKVYDALPDGLTAYTVSGNRIRFTLLPEMLTVAGEAQVALRILRASDKHLISTFVFDIVVEAEPSFTAKAAADEPPIAGIDELPTLVSAIKSEMDVTVTAEYLDGSKVVTTIELNDNGNPVSVARGDEVCTLTWEGFDE